MIFVGLSTGSDMLKMVKISLWIPSFGESGLIHSQIWSFYKAWNSGCLMPITLSRFQFSVQNHFLSNFAWLPRHLQLGLMDHQICYSHRWYMWRCNWGVLFTPTLFHYGPGALKLKKWLFCLFPGTFLSSVSSQPLISYLILSQH